MRNLVLGGIILMVFAFGCDSSPDDKGDGPDTALFDVEVVDALFFDEGLVDAELSMPDVRTDQGVCGLEVCDGLDNDCDGQIDEDVSGEICQIEGALGVCAEGVIQCAGGESECVVTNMPNVEICNGVDDDCDGVVDNALSDEGQPCEITSATGLCATGISECINGELICTATHGVTEEVCNGLDDDCDGEIDEEIRDLGMPCTSDLPGACSQGRYACQVGVSGANQMLCVPVMNPNMQSELCNGEDDDCDGLTDEGLGVGVPCERGSGACYVQGETACNAQGELTCTATAGSAGAEICNGTDRTEFDEDCDGNFNENTATAPGSCSAGTGACQRSGRFICTQLADGNYDLVCDAIAAVGSREVCNGVSDDCDDVVDEEVEEVGQSCVTNFHGVCSEGTYECLTDEGTTSLNCRPKVTPNERVEVFNCLDDDCDGIVDEDADGVNGPCPGTGLPGTYCALGQFQCVGDENPRVECVSNQPRPEICNGIDDDCDENIDNDVEGFGELCDAGLAEAEPGTNLCNAGVRQCRETGNDVFELLCVSSAEPRCEAIDDRGLDEDCDGVIDEMPEAFCGDAALALEKGCIGVGDYSLPQGTLGGPDDGMHIGSRHTIAFDGLIHFARVSNSGEMIYSRIGSGQTQTRHMVIGTAISGIRSASIAMNSQHQPVIAFALPPPFGPLVFTTSQTHPTLQEQWGYEQVDSSSYVGSDIVVFEFDQKLRIAYREIVDVPCETGRRSGARNDFACDSRLIMATKDASGWSFTTVNESDGAAFGHGLSYAISPDESTLYLVHGDALNGNLHVDSFSGEQWRHHEEMAVPVVDNRPAPSGTTGMRPSVAVFDDEVVVVHGAWQGNDELDQLADSGRVYVTRYDFTAQSWYSQSLTSFGEFVGGGQSVADLGGAPWVFARERFRSTGSAISDLDTLKFGRIAPPEVLQTLETWSFNDTRHLFNNLQLSSDAFGLPFMSFSDQPGGVCFNVAGVEYCPIERVCFYRAADSDGDRVPDYEENRRGTNPNDPDSDGDGRTDGEEILEHNSDPLMMD